MRQNINLEELEHKAWGSVFHDGLWDLYLGLLLLVIGISIALKDMRGGLSRWGGIILLPLVILLFGAGKKHITAPRLGRIKVSEAHNSDMLQRAATTIAALVLGATLFGLVLSVKLPAVLPVLAWIIVCVVVFSLAAYFTGVKRLYLYGVLYALPHSGRALLKMNAELGGISSIIFFVSAGIMITIGARLLIRFWSIPS